ncbi:MAG: hypothetical protein ISS52_03815 [Dehalococcoidia bacterium]|nr:hypothetical protein [Dehalococcoidia bacterium]
MVGKPWEDIDYSVVRDHYNHRVDIHRELRRAFEQHDISRYVPLALGISENAGNYSAAEHVLGPRVLQHSTPEQVFDLAARLFACNSPAEIPRTIYNAKLPYLKISVGSEMAAMLRPDVFWVTNVRTVWAHLVIKHDGDITLANEELSLYRDQDSDSGMDYSIWSEIHGLVGPSLLRLADLGSEAATKQNNEPGDLTFLWADAIADTLYVKYS